MPRISVVVPIYNVEEYLAACLDSIAQQTVGDLEVIMVDDGSTDGGPAIAEAYAARDPRFRLIRQENGGLSKARNTGTDVAAGEFLSFVDSDDVLPLNAYELLLGSLDKTGSDFATGNVHRLSYGKTTRTPFLARTFTRTRLKTHVSRFRDLLADRTAWNKLWRKSFWDAHGLRFPEGRVHEDIPVTIPAHCMARSVDVISEPVYYYRIREGGELSITQRRLEPKVLRDRFAAVEDVSDYLEREGPRKVKRWYDASVIGSDLSYHLNVLEQATDEYREEFVERANTFLDRVDRRVVSRLPAIERLKWHLVQRRLLPELLEVLRFQREDLRETPPVRIGRHWYGDYPFRTDEKLAIPRQLYRLGRELTLHAGIDALRLNGTGVEVEGYAYIDGVGAPERDSQRVTVIALRPGRLRRLRVRTTLRRARSAPIHRPELRAITTRPTADPAWAGFHATFDPRKLRRIGRWHEGSWELYLAVRAGGVTRRRMRFELNGGRLVRAVEQQVADGVVVRAAPTPGREVMFDVAEHWARLTAHRAVDGAVELSGELQAPPPGKLELELEGRVASGRRRYPATASGTGFTARVPLDELLPEPDEATGEPPRDRTWDVYVTGGGRRLRLRFPDDVEAAVWPCADREVQLLRTLQAEVSLTARRPRLVITAAAWSEDGVLELAGELPPGGAPAEIVLSHRRGVEQHAFALQRSGGRFTARLTPASITSLAGSLPLREGKWDLKARAADGEGLVSVTMAPALGDVVPLRATVRHKPFTLRMSEDGAAILGVKRDLDDDEHGRFNQHRMRRTVHAPAREQPLRDAVVYSSFRGRQYSDSPRAIHEELVRRDAPLEHLWVVGDGQCEVPATATVLRDGSREYYEALGNARYVVYNDHFPDWFLRRTDQVCVQTWHGTPLKKLGYDASQKQRTIRRFERGWREQLANWQYVISPNRFSTPFLRQAYAVEGEMLETGYPRDDVLAGAGREEASARLRRRLGLPDGVRVVLYAPTYRDQVTDRLGRYRLDLRLEVERLRDVVGPDTVLLMRKHHYVIDDIPVTDDGFVRDVSSYPDGTELMLAADVLVTDYSSMMFDFANTGRPMLFFTYDLDAYRDEIRGFYFDFVDTAPGPLLRTSDDVAEALRDLDAVTAEYAERYAAFASTFCELDDGHASARVVDRVFSW